MRTIRGDGPAPWIENSAEALAELLSRVDRLIDLDPSGAIEVANEAIALAESDNDNVSLAWALHHRGRGRLTFGSIDQALADQVRAHELFAEAGVELGMGRSMAFMAAPFDMIGDVATALDHLERALEIQRRIGDRWGEARSLNILSVCLSGTDRLDDALEALVEVERVFGELGDDRWVAYARFNRAETLSEIALNQRASGATEDEWQATVREAAEIYDSLIERARDIDDPVLLAYGHQGRGMARCDLGDARGLGELRAAEDVARGAGVVQQALDIAVKRARALVDAERHDEALTLLDDVEREATDTGRTRFLVESLRQRSRALEARGDHAGALDAFRRYHDMESGIRSEAAELRSSVMSQFLQVERARHETELAEVRLRELEAAANDRERFVATVSHELRTPITSVLGLSSELRDSWDTFGRADVRELVGLIALQAEDAAIIVEDLLTVARLARNALKVDRTVVSAHEAVETVLRRFRQEQIDIDLSGAAWVYADAARLRQILRNLVTNAIRYGGDRIRVVIVSLTDRAHIEVRDDGLGIPPEDLERAFEPFGRSDLGIGNPDSVGLGLPAALDLARLMGGSLAYDRDGGETVFRLTLPRAASVKTG